MKAALTLETLHIVLVLKMLLDLNLAKLEMFLFQKTEAADTFLEERAIMTANGTCSKAVLFYQLLAGNAVERVWPPCPS